MKLGLIVIVVLAAVLGWVVHIANAEVKENQQQIKDLAVKCEIAGGRLLRFNDALLGNAVGCFTGLTEININ